MNSAVKEIYKKIFPIEYSERKPSTQNQKSHHDSKMLLDIRDMKMQTPFTEKDISALANQLTSGNVGDN